MNNNENALNEESNEETNIDNNEDNKNTSFAALTHFSAMFAWVLGPLIIYIVSNDQFVKDNAATALDWQISFTLWIILSIILSFVLIGFIGFILFPLLDIIFIIMAAVKASDGEVWDYPLTLKIVSK